MSLIQHVKDSHKFEEGDKVLFKLGRDTPYENEIPGVIIKVIPYGIAAYYVIEYNGVVDHALHMDHSLFVRVYE